MRYVITVAVLAAIYLGAAKLGLSFAFATQQVTAVWPPTGVALAALLLLGARFWPGILVGAFAANATHGEPLATAAGIAVGNTLGPVAGAVLLRRVLRFDDTVFRLREVFGLAIGAIVVATITSANGVLHLVRGDIVPADAYGAVWWVWWIGDLMGALLVAPVVLAWAADHRLPWRGWRVVEAVALLASLVGGCLYIFQGAPVLQMQYMVFPFTIWCALRFDVRETATVTAIIAAIALWGTVHDRGPFAAGTLDERLVLLDVFLLIAVLVPLSLSTVTAERRRAEAALQQAHDELERRVRERTAALAAVNTELTSKSEEVEAFVYTVSHDLRAPLVNLQGFTKELQLSLDELTEKLRGAPLPASLRAEIDLILREDVGAALRFISASSSKFERLIEALLRLSRYGRQGYRSDAVDVGAVVESTLGSLRQSIEAGGAKVAVAGPLPDALGDPTAIEQVFANLIGNALKYAAPGRPGVIEIGGDAEAHAPSARYWIRDNGVGIGEAAQRHLFQVFQRFHPHLAQGEGMGLAIVKRIVERHGGQVRIESEEGVGTTVHFTLRRQQGAGERMER